MHRYNRFTVCGMLLLAHSLCGFANPPGGKNEAIISCNGIPPNDSGTIVVALQAVYGADGAEEIDPMGDDPKMARNGKYEARAMNGSFELRLRNIGSPKWGYLNYYAGKRFKYLVNLLFMIESGDSVIINIAGDSGLVFSGRHADKYELQYQLSGIYALLGWKETKAEDVLSRFLHIDSLAVQSLKRIEACRDKIGITDYWLLRARTVSDFQMSKLYYMTNYCLHCDVDAHEFVQGLAGYRNPIWNNEIRLELQRPRALQHDIAYLGFLIDQYRCDSSYGINGSFDLVKCYSYFTKIYGGAVREWIIDQLIRQNYQSPQDLAYCIDHAFRAGYIKNRSIRKYLAGVRNMLPGTSAFDFSLSDTSGNTVRLAHFSGKVILMDFWFKGCGACKMIHPILDSIKSLFGQRAFDIVSVCIDDAGLGRKKWVDLISGGTYTSVDNTNLYLGAGKRSLADLIATDPLLRHYKIEGCPTLILIDKKGKLTKTPVDPREDKGMSLVRTIQANL